MDSKKEKADATAVVVDKIKAAALSAAKGLSRTQAERAAAAAARNVNAYGQKEEGPSRWQERKEAKRQMYLMSTERAVILGVRKPDASKFGVAGTFEGSQQCQKCFQMGHWTYECRNERVYISRPTRTQQLTNPKLRPKLMDSIEVLLDSQALCREFTSQKADNSGQTEKKRNKRDSDGLTDSNSVENDVVSESSGDDHKKRGKSRSRKMKRRRGSLSSSTSDDDHLKQN